MVLAFRTPAPRWPAFLPAYRSRVLAAPPGSGRRVRSELVATAGTQAIVGSVTDTRSGLTGHVAAVGFDTLLYLIEGTSRDQVLSALDAIAALALVS